MRIMKDADLAPADQCTAGVSPAKSPTGFALILSLILVLILTIFAYWMLLLVQNHYAASKMLFDSDNARTISEAAAFHLVQQHNTKTPRFFTDPLQWNHLQMKPFTWQDYGFTGHLKNPWDAVAVNQFTLRGRKARSFAEWELPLRQIRLEDFALLSDHQQHLNSSTLFDGLVFIRSGLTLDHPALFRSHVHNEVSPLHLATFKRKTSPTLDFPLMETLLPEGWESHGFVIALQDPRFWQLDHYELDLDQLEIVKSGDFWKVNYKGTPLGEASALILSFDDTVHIKQTFRELPHLPTAKPEAPIYMASLADIQIKSNIQHLESSEHEHPICLIAARTIQIVPSQRSVRIEACLVASGEQSAQVAPGALSLSAREKQSWISEIRGSALLMEPAKREEFLKALSSDEKIVWFRGSMGIKGTLVTAPDITQMYFEASRNVQLFLNSFPFVQVVEGKEKWL